MKRCFTVILCAALLLCCFGCSDTQVKDISCEDVIAAYEKAGYEVFHKDASYEDNGVCYVRVDDPKSDDYVYFEFFEDAESAQSYAEKRQWNVLLYLFSVIYSDPTWLTTKTYGNIEYEYDNDELIKPFEQLIK